MRGVWLRTDRKRVKMEHDEFMQLLESRGLADVKHDTSNTVAEVQYSKRFRGFRTFVHPDLVERMIVEYLKKAEK